MVGAYAIGRSDVDSPASPSGLTLTRGLSELASPVMTLPAAPVPSAGVLALHPICSLSARGTLPDPLPHTQPHHGRRYDPSMGTVTPAGGMR